MILNERVNNLLTIYQALVGGTKAEVEAHFDGKRYGDLKKEVAEAVLETIKPIQVRYNEITADSGYLDELLAAGAERARNLAAPSTLAAALSKYGIHAGQSGDGCFSPVAHEQCI